MHTKETFTPDPSSWGPERPELRSCLASTQRLLQGGIPYLDPPFLAIANFLKAVYLPERTAFSMQQHFCRGSLGTLPLARGVRLSSSHVTTRQVVAASLPRTTEQAPEAFRRKSVIQLIDANVELNVSPPSTW